MRLISLFAAIALGVGVSLATPAAAETHSAKPVTTVVSIGLSTASADQYRTSYRYRYRAGWRQYRYRPHYYAGRRWNRGWRRGGLSCRTSWRHGRSYRVCWRR